MGKIYAAKTNHIHKPFRVLSETVGIFMESERRQRTGTETCKDYQQEQNLLQISVTIQVKQELDSLSTRVEFETQPYTRYYWKVIVTTDAEEVIESDTQFLRPPKWMNRGRAGGLRDSSQERHPIFLKENSSGKRSEKRKTVHLRPGIV